MWLLKIRRYINIILDDNLLLEFINFQKYKNKEKQLVSYDKAKQKIKLISSNHKPISLFIEGYGEKSQGDCSKDNSPHQIEVVEI
jgi:hypothetical protein